MNQEKRNEKSQIILLLIFIVSAVSVMGSLYFSLVLKLPPCELCWYQRICMYPISVIALFGLAKERHDSLYYITPFAIFGSGIAVYHNLLYYGVIENIVPCAEGVSCTSKLLEWFGFLTIPLMSLVGFILISTGLIFSYFRKMQ